MKTQWATRPERWLRDWTRYAHEQRAKFSVGRCHDPIQVPLASVRDQTGRKLETKMNMEQPGRRPGRDQVRAGEGVGKSAESRG